MPRTRLIWTFIVTSVAAFMVGLDNLVVTMALPSIRSHLHASLASLEWTINAYTLSFAVLIITGAALGDRFGRRRMLTIGLTVFTLASAGAALAPNVTMLVVARAIQGAGAAAVLPLTFTILASSVPAERRGAALGVLGGVSGLAVAVGPLVGGAVVQGASWQWIFWINVPIGLLALPFAATRLSETKARAHLDPLGLVLASAGLFGIVFGLVKASDDGWTSLPVLGSILPALSSWSPSLSGRPKPPTPCCRCDSSAAGPLAPPTWRRCSSASECSGASSCWPSSSRPHSGTRPSRPACARCRGRRCLCSWLRSPDRCRTASEGARSWSAAWPCKPSVWPG